MLHYHWYKLSYFTILFVALSMFVIETNGGIINMDFALHEEDNKFPPISCVFKHKASEDKSNFNFVKNLLDSKERKYYFIIDREHKNILKYRQKYSFCDEFDEVVCFLWKITVHPRSHWHFLCHSRVFLFQSELMDWKLLIHNFHEMTLGMEIEMESHSLRPRLHHRLLQRMIVVEER